MLTRANRLKIGDFGLSKTLSVRNKMPTDIDQNFTMTGETGSVPVHGARGFQARVLRPGG